MRNFNKASLVVLALLAAAPAFAQPQPQPMPEPGTTGVPGATTGTPTTGTTTPTAKLDDSQISKVLTTINDSEIRESKLAKSQSTNPEVKAFADLMNKDHMASNKSVEDMSKQLSLKAGDSDLSRKFETDTKATYDSLANLKGAAFDKAYIEDEVKGHQMVLDTIDKSLLPNVQDAQLRTNIMNFRPIVQAHLDRAKTIQSNLAKAPGTK